MDFNGFVREIDSVGRVVIPKQLRKELGLNEKNVNVVLNSENGCIVMRKAIEACIFCKSENDLAAFNGQHICKNCLTKLKSID